jgi:hypothetical protein
MVYTHLQDDTVARVQSPMDRLGGGLDVAGSKGGGPGTSRKTQKNFNPEANENQHFEEKTEEEGEDS